VSACQPESGRRREAYDTLGGIGNIGVYLEMEQANFGFSNSATPELLQLLNSSPN
jgi:hypothetical protein